MEWKSSFLVTRWSLKNLPYSVEEVYKLVEKGKYPGTKKVFNRLEQYYVTHRLAGQMPEKVVTEDEKAG